MDKINKMFENIQLYFVDHPNHVFYLLGTVLLIFGVASLFGKKWGYSTANSNQRAWYNFLGEKWFARIIGILFILAAIACYITGTIWKVN